ncbi:MAG: hypothetical protein AB7S26_12885 [Sandaracinaceae bacterium]
MNVAGHLAVAFLATGERARLRRAGLVLIGTLTPDIIDKSAQLVHLTPYGRTAGHSTLLWGSLALLTMIAWSRSHDAADARAFVLGGVLHLAVDLVDDVVEGLQQTGYLFSAWAGWPWTNPDELNVRVPHLLPHGAGYPTFLEGLTMLVVVAIALARARHRNPSVG